MLARMMPRVALLACLLTVCAHLCEAEAPKAGLTLDVEVEKLSFNPLVTKILVTKVDKPSLAEAAGIVAGDEILQVDGQPVTGKHARELRTFGDVRAGETWTLHLKHPNGEPFDARLTKPRE